MIVRVRRFRSFLGIGASIKPLQPACAESSRNRMSHQRLAAARETRRPESPHSPLPSNRRHFSRVVSEAAPLETDPQDLHSRGKKSSRMSITCYETGLAPGEAAGVDKR